MSQLYRYMTISCCQTSALSKGFPFPSQKIQFCSIACFISIQIPRIRFCYPIRLKSFVFSGIQLLSKNKVALSITYSGAQISAAQGTALKIKSKQPTRSSSVTTSSAEVKRGPVCMSLCVLLQKQWLIAMDLSTLPATVAVDPAPIIKLDFSMFLCGSSRFRMASSSVLNPIILSPLLTTVLTIPQQSCIQFKNLAILLLQGIVTEAPPKSACLKRVPNWVQSNKECAFIYR